LHSPSGIVHAVINCRILIEFDSSKSVAPANAIDPHVASFTSPLPAGVFVVFFFLVQGLISIASRNRKRRRAAALDAKHSNSSLNSAKLRVANEEDLAVGYEAETMDSDLQGPSSAADEGSRSNNSHRLVMDQSSSMTASMALGELTSDVWTSIHQEVGGVTHACGAITEYAHMSQAMQMPAANAT
jgi:hypothetical protein